MAKAKKMKAAPKSEPKPELPFLHIITRTYKRPDLLKHNQEWLQKQTDPDYIQEILEDTVGMGVAKANAQLREVEAKGRFVWILDDDDFCSDPEMIAKLKRNAENEHPDCFVVNAKIGGVVFPLRWPPKVGEVGNINFMSSRDVWERHRGDYGYRYAGDFDYIDSVLKGEKDLKVSFYSPLAAQTVRVSRGAPESEPPKERPDLDPGQRTLLQKSIRVTGTREYGLKVGTWVRAKEAVSGPHVNFSQDQRVQVTEKNIDVIESLLRGGLMVEISPFQGHTDPA